MTQRRPPGRSLRDDRVWQAGFLVGSALGVAATVVGRRLEYRCKNPAAAEVDA